MSVLRRALIAICFIASLPVIWGQLMMFAGLATSVSPYIGDEIFVVEPAISVFEGGYRGFRCMERQTGACYGGTQPLIDGVMLRALPRQWSEADQYKRAEGVSWSWLIRYPNLFTVMRVSRFFYFALLLMLVLAVSRRVAGGMRSLLFLSVIVSAATIEAVSSGAKNDFPCVLWEGLFLIAMAFVFKTRSSLLRFVLFLAALVPGFFAAFGRLALAPQLFLAVFFYLAIEAFATRSVKQIIARAVVIGAFLAALFIGFHPNSFVSSFEAFWFRHFIVMSQVPAEAYRARFLAELPVALRSIWPMVFFAWGLFLFSREKGKRETVFRWIFHAAAVLVGAYLYLKAARGGQRYYLTVLTSSVFSVALLLRELRRPLPKLFVPSFAVALLAFSPALHDLKHFSHWEAFGKPQRDELERLVNDPADVSDADWLFDVSLHPAVRQATLSKRSVRFFDSLSDSPSDVLLQASSPKSKIVVACWEGASSNLAPGDVYQSPSASLWAKTLRERCPLKERLSEAHVFRHVQGYRKKPYAVLTAKDLTDAAKSIEMPTIQNSRLLPQFLKGAENGFDHYEMPLLVTSPIKLSGVFSFPKGLKSAQVRLKSGCKGPDVKVALAVTAKKGTAYVAERAIDASDPFCADYPRLCQVSAFREWSWRRYPVEGPKLQAALAPQSVAKIEAELSKPPGSHCPVVLESVDFTF